MSDDIGGSEPVVEPPPARIGSGTVAYDGLGVAGVDVRATAGSDGEEIATGITDADGGFELHADCRTLRRLECLEEPIRVSAGRGRWEVTVPFSEGVEIELPDRVRAARAPWPRIAKIVRSSITPTIGSLATELRSLSPTAAFRDFTASQRLAAYSELIEIGRRVMPFEVDALDLEALPVGLDPDALADRDIGRAIVVDLERIGELWDRIDQYWRWDWKPDTSTGTHTLIGYRDYLLYLLVKAQKDWIQHRTLSDSQYVARLEHRFHQDFRTRSVTPVVAAENVVRVLEAVLVAPTEPGYGIGLKPSDIPPRGDQSPTERLAQLVRLTGLPGRMVQNRWRVQVDLPSDLVRSPVEQNIATLQRVMTDTAQQNPEPWPVAPDLITGAGTTLPLLNHSAPPSVAYRSHFHFLRYEEWLELRQPMFLENLFDIRATAAFTVSLRSRELLADQASLAAFAGAGTQYIGESEATGLQYARCVVDAYDMFGRGVTAFEQLRYEEAISIWEELSRLIGNMSVVPFSISQIAAVKRELRRITVTTPEQLKSYEEWSTCSVRIIGPETQGAGRPPRVRDWPETRMYWASRLFLLRARVLPVVRAEAHIKLGDYRSAVDLLADIARFPVMTNDIPGGQGLRNNNTADPSKLTAGAAFSSSNTEGLSTKHEALGGIPHSMEQAHNRLWLGIALLEWADSLYRSGEPENISRAREAYKAVMYLHGEDPDLDPGWQRLDHATWPGLDRIHAGAGLPLLLAFRTNPAVRSQVSRARAAFLQIEAGLNFYGTSAEYVPPVRYLALRQAAEQYAAGAKATQDDFLSYVDAFERRLIDEKKARASVRKAEAAIAIASEEEKIAAAAVAEVQAQIDALKAQAIAKRKEYEEQDSFWGQVKSAVSSLAGAKDEFQKLACGITGVISGEHGAAGTAKLTDIGKAAMSKDALASLTQTAGGGVAATAGIALFTYYGVKGLESWTDGLTKLRNEYEQIEKVAIPAAEKTKALKQREVRITQLRAEVARADADLGRDLLRFYAYRVGNAAFWLTLARLASDLLTRYLDLGARHAWLAQQALAFETGSLIRVVAMDYTNSRMRDIGGADRLLLNLAELEAVRLAALGTTVPVKWQMSLSSSAPRAFAALRETGVCEFMTRERDIRAPYPGLYGLRLRAVGVEVKTRRVGPPPRGLLVNYGISLVTDPEGTAQRLTRYADGVALSDFTLRGDMAVYSLPDEALLPFEGSGLDTAWRLELPPAESQTSRDVIDVSFTFDVRGRYSAALHAKVARTPLPPSRHATAVSLQSLFPEAFADLVAGTGDVDIALDPLVFAFDPAAVTRILTGIALAVTGKPVELDLKIATTDLRVAVPNDGTASSVGTMAGAQPLDPLLGADFTQPLQVRIPRAGQSPGALKALGDLVIAVDFEES